MKKIFVALLFWVTSAIVASASEYNLYTPDKVPKIDNGERILFILDFSSSMEDPLENSTKFRLMLQTMKRILPKISPESWVGLRIYGHKLGFTPIEACRASSLVTPIGQNNISEIGFALSKAKPRGMTPITYSLKQAIKYDFMGYSGKKHIILMTDGGENCDESPCTFVMNLIKIRKDVHIDVIAFNIKDSEDLEQLQCTALVTSGKFYNAQTSAQLLDGFNKSIGVSTSVDAKILLP